MARKRQDRVAIFSVFGVCEAAAASYMIKRGEAVRIPKEQIPETAAVNKLGHPALFAVRMDRDKVARFEELIKDMRA